MLRSRPSLSCSFLSRPLLLFALWLVSLLPIKPATAQTAPIPTGFTESQVALDLFEPTAMEFAPDGRLFVAQQEGKLRIVKNGALLATPFVTVDCDSAGERGLLGVTLDPDFATNHYVYVYYTATAPTVHNRVSRFTASGDVAAAHSETILFELENLNSSTGHNGGALHFGPDGKLYIAVGDNGYSANSQNRYNLLGKILRINKDGTIPSDNPYNHVGSRYDALWAMGLRNPFTFAFQPGSGRLFINDVGAATWEEINDGIAGSNYGWPDTEGPTTNPSYRSPLYSYNHGSDIYTGYAITGGVFYAATQFPAEYRGKYFFSDYVNGWIKYIDPAAPATATVFADMRTDISIVDLDVGPDGSLYYLSLGHGGVYKISYTLAPGIKTHPQSLARRPGQSATFTVEATGATPLTYQWQRNRSNISGAKSASYTINSVALGDNGAKFRVIVTNGSGSVTSNEATLTVTNNDAPVPAITAPATTAVYRAGETIAFSGGATDAQDGTLANSKLSWRVVFHHDTHTHPFLENIDGVGSGTFTIPTTGETSTNVWYRIYLTATDSGGLTTTVYRDIHPLTTTLKLDTVPTGLQITVDGQPMDAPLDVPSVVGMHRIIGAVSPQTHDGITYTFGSWSDGGAATHEIVAPATTTTYQATFADTTAPTIAMTEPVDNYSYRTLTAATGTAADTGSGVKTVTGRLQRLSDNAYWSGSTWTATSTDLDAIVTLNGNAANGDAATWQLPLPALADGKYALQVTASDAGGNHTSSPVVQFYIDTIAPAPVVVTPAVNAAYNALAQASGTAADSGPGVAGVAGHLYRYADGTYWNGSAWTATDTALPATGTDNWTLALPPLVEGRYALRAVALDYIGNAGSSPVVDFFIDSGAPQVAITSPQNGTAYAGLTRLLGTAADSAGVAAVRVRLFYAGAAGYWNGTAWVKTPVDVPAQGTTAWSLTVPSLPNGKFVATAIARDAAGNAAASAPVTFTVDTSAPAVTVTYPVSKAVYAKPPTARGTAIDTGLGTKRVELLLYRYANGATPAGYWEGGNRWNRTYNAATQERPALGGKNWALNLPNLPTGIYYVRATAFDVAGNYRRSSPVVFSVDRTAPTVAVTAPVNGLTTPSLTQATGTAGDIGSGLQRVTVALYRYANGSEAAGYWAGSTTWTPQYNVRSNERPVVGSTRWALALPPLTAGRYWLRATAYDRAGYFTRSTLSVFTIRNTAPSGQATLEDAIPPSPVVLSPVTLSNITTSNSAVRLNWTGALDASNAIHRTHYQVFVDGEPAAIVEARLSNDGHNVALLLNEGILRPGSSLQVSWSNLRDIHNLDVKAGFKEFVLP